MAKSSPALKEAKKRYYQKNKEKHLAYNKATYRQFAIRINRAESEVISHLDQQENKSGYIVNLIKEDMKKSSR